MLTANIAFAGFTAPKLLWVKENEPENFARIRRIMLPAASANRWWLEDILNTNDYEEAVRGAALGESRVYFLPYLMGERSPHNDVNARGAFIGMRTNTTRAQMSLAVPEGVAYALRDCVEAAKAEGLFVTRTTICGGAASV